MAMGIPGSVIDAILLGALVLHGLQPGVLLFHNHPEIVYTIIFTMLIANLAMFGMMLLSAKWISKLATIPRVYLLPVVVVFCVVGSYALNNRMFDVWVMLGFGVVGFMMERSRIPLAPFVIGFVLAPIAEEKLGAGLQATGGSYAPLATRPVALILILVSLVLVVWPIVKTWRKSGRREVE